MTQHYIHSKYVGRKETRALHYLTIVYAAHLAGVGVGVAAWRKSEHIRAGHVGHIVIPEPYITCVTQKWSDGELVTSAASQAPGG